MRAWFQAKIKGIAVTVSLVIIGLQVIIPTLFHVLTSVIMLVIVWWCAKLHRRK